MSAKRFPHRQRGLSLASRLLIFHYAYPWRSVERRVAEAAARPDWNEALAEAYNAPTGAPFTFG